MIGKIALGVFLGNLAFALLAWFVIGMRMQEASSAASIAATNAQYEAMFGNAAAATSPR